jgi:hypothetical protein
MRWTFTISLNICRSPGNRSIGGVLCLLLRRTLRLLVGVIIIVVGVFNFKSKHTIWMYKLNHGPTIWDKKWGDIGNIFENTLGTREIFGDPNGNILRTWWEHSGKRSGIYLSSPPSLPHGCLPWKTRPPWAFSLVAWNFYLQNGWSPFSTWINTPTIN